MAINFPNSPGIGSVFTDPTSGFSYQWDGTVWATYTPASLVLLVERRNEIVSVPISVGSNIINDNSYAGYAANAGIATYAGYATSAGIATYAATAGIATYADVAGISTTSSSSTGGAQINDLDLALFD